jgi:dihydroflavonol-4-reductase
MPQTVLLTGVSGYIGLHIAKQLLNAGYCVRGSVRNKAKAKEVSETLLAAQVDITHFTSVELDLALDDGFEDAAKGCDYVMHVASPYVIANPKSEDELIVPAVEGTLRVLSAAKKMGVKRVVVTSSIMAMMGDMKTGEFGPNSWTDPQSPNINTYTKSKTLAEKAAWDFMAAHSSETIMQIVTINPGGVVGPPLGRVITGQSMAMLDQMLRGKLPMLPNVAVPLVDVRDLATLHVLAMTADNVAGKRIIAASAKASRFIEIAQILKDSGYKGPSTRLAPNFLLRFMSLFDREAKGMLGMLDTDVSADNTQTIALLNWTQRSLKESVLDSAAVVKTLIKP